MIVLILRTDKPEAELGLYEDDRQLAYITWHAHRELSGTIHEQIEELLQGRSLQQGLSLQDVEGIVVYKGPGSFTGLRIGLSVANALAYSLSIPTTAKSGKNWVDAGIKSLKAGENDKISLPKYDQPAGTTKPRK